MRTNSIILASQSPRRKQLLEWAAQPFEVVVSKTDESFPESLGFSAAAIHIARNKALQVQQKVDSEKIILAADTIVICEGQWLGKPADRDDALRMLALLSGKSHEVITGVVILTATNERSFAETTRVHFHPLTPEQIAYYVDEFQPYDKAGAYAIQEWIGVTGIKSIEGDFYNVMGLPVSRVMQELVFFVCLHA